MIGAIIVVVAILAAFVVGVQTGKSVELSKAAQWARGLRRQHDADIENRKGILVNQMECRMVLNRENGATTPYLKGHKNGVDTCIKLVKDS
jgi:hypothetical protein